MAAYPFKEIEAKWQAHWESQATFRTARRTSTRRSLSTTCSTCSRTRPATGCTSAIPKATRRPTSSPATSACAASTCCTRWAGTRSACRPSSTRSRPARIRASRRSATSSASASRSRRSASRTTGSARSTRPTPATTSGRSGSSSSSSSAASPIKRSCPSGGAPSSAPCSRTRRSSTASPRSAAPCVRRPLRQWVLKITRVRRRAARRASTTLDWPSSTKEMQRNWIGRSEGAEIDFAVEPATPAVAASRLHDAARHAVRRDLHGAGARAPARRDAHDARAARGRRRVSTTGASRKSELERTELQKDKTGVFTGAYAVNPATGGKIPIWIADYVLAGYGTGAIMAVPGADERDFEFAQKFGLPVIRTVQPPAGLRRQERVDSATASSINSGFLNGKSVEQAKAAMIDWLERERKGERRVNYKLRDWLFSRQRYWGEPFPIVFVDGKPQTVRRRRAARAAARARGLQAERHARRARSRRPARGSRPSTRRPARRRAARRTRCRSGPARAGTTCASSIRRTTTQLVDPEAREVLAARRPLRRRLRARRAASALCALLAQGALRRRRRLDAGAVPEARAPGNDPGRARVHGERRARRRGSGREARRPLRAARRSRRSPSKRAPTR